MKKNDPKVLRAWTFYDWANSVYSLSITTAIFPIYYNSITSANGSDEVTFLGRTFTNTALYSYALSFSFLVIAFLSPLHLVPRCIFLKTSLLSTWESFHLYLPALAGPEASSFTMPFCPKLQLPTCRTK